MTEEKPPEPSPDEDQPEPPVKEPPTEEPPIEEPPPRNRRTIQPGVVGVDQDSNDLAGVDVDDLLGG